LAHFGEWPKPAAHKLWTSARLEKLYEHVAEIRSRRPGLRDEAIARILKESKQYRGTYGQYSKKYIGERIRDARNSKDGFEDTLKKHLIFTRGLCEAIGLQWTSELESERSHSFKETARRISGASAAD